MIDTPTQLLTAIAKPPFRHAQRWAAVVWWYSRNGRAPECTAGRVAQEMFDAGYPKQNTSLIAKAFSKDRRITRVNGKVPYYSVKVTSQQGMDEEFGPHLNAQTNGVTPRASVAKTAQTLNNRVFVVHGHDHGFKNTVARFLETLGLDAVILHEKSDGGRTVIEKFERESNVGFAVVLATPDDLGKRAKGMRAADPDRPRARQNVIFELGYFVGKLGRGLTSIVTESDVELPSDLAGVVYIDRRTWQKGLFDALTAAGFQFDQVQTQAALAIHG